MATTLQKPQAIPFLEPGLKLAGSLHSHAESQTSRFDALQALLAFSSLNEQIRPRRPAAGQPFVAKGSPEEFVLSEVLQLVAERALALSGADGVAIALVQEGEIICRARTGTIAPEIGASLDPQCGLSGICFLTGETVCCEDAENDLRVNIVASRNLDARSIIAVPLRGRRSVIGLLEAFSREAFAFSDSDVRSLNLLAELILGAMKPEEEERLEALSPASIRSQGTGADTPQPISFSSHLSVGNQASVPLLDADVLEAELAAENSPSSADIPAALLRDYEKSSTSRSSAVVISAMVLVVIAALAFVLWKFDTPAGALSATTKSPAVSQQRSAPTIQAQTTAQRVSAELPQPSLVPAEESHRNALPILTGVRHWETDDSITVVIDLQDQVQYEVHRLTTPERIYFDLHDTVLAPGLNGTSIEVRNALLNRIRIAQPVAGVARVVLDTNNVSNFSVGLEPNPYRLIIEIRKSLNDGRPKANIVSLPPSTAFPTQVPPPEPLSKEDLELRARMPHLKIVIDAGHGGWDFGTVGRQGVVEKDLVLDISQRLGEMLETRLGSEILYTRSDDAYVPLEERAQIANDAQADLFVSVHANNSDYPSARGVETYYTDVSAPANSLEIEKRENATAATTSATAVLSGVALKERTQQSRHFAASVERALYGTLATKSPGIRDRGVKEAGFVVLTGTTMPAILAEVSFVSSPADEHNLQSSTYRQQIAEALYKGIARYAAASSHVKLASVR